MKKIINSLLIFAFMLPGLGRAEGFLVYKPPKIGAPTSRIGSGTRGLSLEAPKIKVLAPAHTALTSQFQPTLYWYQFEKTSDPVKITMYKEGDDVPIFEELIPPPTEAGVQAIHLADFGVFLLSGQKYRWSVSIVDETGDVCSSCTASASVRYELFGKPSASLEEKAQEGYWYDVLEQLIDSHSPAVNELLKQVDIDVPTI